MKQLLATGIVLARTDFGEADRIVTFLTPDHGKLRLMARGVRKIKSKLAGGIELFSISELTFMYGKGEIGTLISCRLHKHYGQIVQNIDRVQQGYALLSAINKATEDEPEPAYFHLVQAALAALDDADIPGPLIDAWFQAQLLRLGGHTPNLRTDSDGQVLKADEQYDFDLGSVAFRVSPHGHSGAKQIKILRLLFSDNQPAKLIQVQGVVDIIPDLAPLLQLLINSYIVRK